MTFEATVDRRGARLEVTASLRGQAPAVVATIAATASSATGASTAARAARSGASRPRPPGPPPHPATMHVGISSVAVSPALGVRAQAGQGLALQLVPERVGVGHDPLSVWSLPPPAGGRCLPALRHRALDALTGASRGLAAPGGAESAVGGPALQGRIAVQSGAGGSAHRSTSTAWKTPPHPLCG
jgi:hypothetical protein